jgi:8-oxo-dGTP diphosphatase
MANRLPSLQEPDSGFTDAPLHLRNGAKALISRSDRALLVQERHADGSGFWTLPGGGARDDESLSDALRRELLEEIGCRSRVTDPVTTFTYRHSSRENTYSIYTVFDCTLRSEPSPVRSEGILDYQWVATDELPSSTLPEVRRVLRVTANP